MYRLSFVAYSSKYSVTQARSTTPIHSCNHERRGRRLCGDEHEPGVGRSQEVQMDVLWAAELGNRKVEVLFVFRSGRARTEGRGAVDD